MYLLALYTNLNLQYLKQMLFRQVNKFLQCRHNMLSIDNTVQSETRWAEKIVIQYFC